MRRKILEIVLISLLLFPLPLYFIRSDGAATPDALIVMIGYVATALPQIFLIIYILFLQEKPLADFGIKRPSPATLGLALFGLVTILAAMFVVYSLLPKDLGENLLKKPAIRLRSWVEIPVALVFCFTIGYREELFFRSYLMTRLGELGVKPVWAIIGTSVVFGSAHFGQGIIAVVATFCVGLLFALLFHYKKDLHAIALAHAFYNFTLLVFAISVPG